MTQPPDIARILNEAILPACGMLTLAMPGRVMHSRPAVQNLLTICLQESGGIHRRQLGEDGKELPGYRGAFGLPQIERNTISLIQRNEMVQRIRVFGLMLKGTDSTVVCDTIRRPEGDILAFLYARLLLWCEPRPVPCDCEEGWLQYAGRTWRPSRPHQATWSGYWQQAAQVTQGIAV